ISILGCGGTIASRVEYATGAAFPAFSPGDLLLAFPELRGLASFSGRKLFDLLSEDMTPAHWQAVAREVAKEIRSGAQGIVLMHGTDTMGYTAAALSFMLRNLPVPVVLVGSMRSSDRGSSDNAMNLVCSVIAAKSDCAEVGVCMHATLNDDYCFLHRGTKVRKLHTSRRDAFKSVNARPLARVWYRERKFEGMSDYRKRDEKRQLELDDRINPRVGLIWVHPGISPKFVAKLADYYDGVVFAGTGLESALPTNPFGDKLAVSLVPALKSLIASGVAVVLAPQTLFGRINLNVYTTGRTLKALGAIGDGCDWLPETALAKLAWVLGHTRELKKVEEMMLTNYAGEMSARSMIE
ncbi:MAG: Glu-tRNA(Gln) amidotransferase subunit GatD, partial [Candidatus Micrarchaeia archaeon]